MTMHIMTISIFNFIVKGRFHRRKSIVFDGLWDLNTFEISMLRMKYLQEKFFCIKFHPTVISASYNCQRSIRAPQVQHFRQTFSGMQQAMYFHVNTTHQLISESEFLKACDYEILASSCFT